MAEVVPLGTDCRKNGGVWLSRFLRITTEAGEIQMTISEFLQSLKPSGEGSFEDLIGDLLGALTGLRFYGKHGFAIGAVSTGTPLLERPIKADSRATRFADIRIWLY